MYHDISKILWAQLIWGYITTGILVIGGTKYVEGISMNLFIKQRFTWIGQGYQIGFNCQYTHTLQHIRKPGPSPNASIISEHVFIFVFPAELWKIITFNYIQDCTVWLQLFCKLSLNSDARFYEGMIRNSMSRSEPTLRFLPLPAHSLSLSHFFPFVLLFLPLRFLENTSDSCFVTCISG